MDFVVSRDQNSAQAAADPCPTPLSTAQVFQSFERESTAWDIDTPAGPVRGWTLGEGPAIYFLNGLEGTSELFRLIAWLLREEFRCVLFDGRLDPRLSRTKTADIASLPEVVQLRAVADRHEEESFLAYGTGFGGWVALAGLLTEPARFRGAILQAGYAKRRLRPTERMLLLLAGRSKRCLQDVPGWQAIFQQNHRRWFPPFDRKRWEMFEEIAGRVPVSQLALHVRQMKKNLLTDRLAEIDRPVLLLKSEGEGRLLRQGQDELERRLPDVREEWLRDTGLVPHWTHPHRVAKIIRRFADSLQPVSMPV